MSNEEELIDVISGDDGRSEGGGDDPDLRNHLDAVTFHFAPYEQRNGRLTLPLPSRLFASSSEPFLRMHEYTLVPDEPSPATSDSQPSRTGAKAKARAVRQGESEEERKRIALLVGIFATSIFVTAFLLVAITLRMTPQIDEMVRQENERLLSLLTQPGSEPQGGVQESDNAFSSTSTNPSTETPGPVPVQADVHAGGEA